MAISSRRSSDRGATRRIFGTFTLHGDRRNTRLTISRDLDAFEEFPSRPGEEVRVELVIDDEGEAFLEVRPLEG